MNSSVGSYSFSYWEKEAYFSEVDLIVVGAGIVGLNAALSFKELRPSATVVVLERGMIPQGASSRNAGFACFGSVSEICDDLESMEVSSVLSTLKMRLDGLRMLKSRVGDDLLQYQPCGGVEVFRTKEDMSMYVDRLHELNQYIESATGLKHTYEYKKAQQSDIAIIRKAGGYIFNKHEGLLHPGMMMTALESQCRDNNIRIYYGCQVEACEDDGAKVLCHIHGGAITTRSLLIATNGFASHLLDDLEVQPVRNQVLITSPMAANPLSAGYHFNKGYVYFRPVGDRILIGGGRHLNKDGEQTSQFGMTDEIKNYLINFLQAHILNGQKPEIDMEWSGILGVGKTKDPIVKMTGPRTGIAVRMGGMGVAIGSMIGKSAAQMIHDAVD